jgi:PAS domain S-box-containing protein
MDNSSFLKLIHNASLLLAIALIFDLAAVRWRNGQVSFWRIPVGVVLGGIGIALMLTPWVFTPGIIFDTRSILMGISGLFFGMVPTIIAMAITAIFRLSQGGVAAWTGFWVIVVTGLTGLAWRRYRRNSLADISEKELYLFGLIIHILMLALMFTLPLNTALEVLSNITLPVLVIYPLGTMLLGMLMASRLRRERTSVALTESEERLRLAIQASNIGFFVHDVRNDKEFYSAEWKSQLGYADHELVGSFNEWKNRLHPDDRIEAIAHEEQYLQGNHHPSQYESEFRLRHRDGSYRWILSRGLLQYGQDGQPESLLGCHIDVTRQKRNEQAMLASEQRFRSLAESSQDYIMLYDRHGRHVYMNPAGLQVSGFKPEDIIGKTHRQAGFSEELSTLWEADIEEVFETGNSSQRLFDWEGAEGRVFLDWRLSPVLSSDGCVNLVLGVSRDITSQKHAEEKLRKNEELYRVLTENIKDVVWILDISTMYFRYISPSIVRLRGFTPEEVIEKPITDAMSPGARDGLIEMINSRVDAYLTGREPSSKFYSDEVEQPCKDGSTVWTEIISNYYTNPDNGHIEVRGVTRDINQRKQADALLLETTQELWVAYDATLQGWSNALEMREHETAGHSQRVVRCTIDLAHAVGINPEEIIHIQRGALLHDIGKMGIPDSILLKPGPLTDDEWVIMRQHPIYAWRLLSKIPYLKSALDIPYSHHERWDGSGYPQGLKGEAIPLAARIFAVVDVWDALLSARPYRPAWERPAVFQYLKDHSGRQFDPRVVKAFLKMMGSDLQ